MRSSQWKNNLILFASFISIAGCTGKISIGFNPKPLLVEEETLKDVVLSKTTPSAASDTVAQVELHAVGEPDATITLYKDNQCSVLVETKTDASGEVDFTVPLTDYGVFDFFAKQTKNSLSSNCTPVAVSYTYRPAALSTLNLISPSNPGGSDAPVLEADGVIAGASVSFYTDASCSLPSLHVSGSEYNLKARVTGSLSSTGDYLFYATQTINGAASACSSASIAYTYRTSCSGSDLTNSPYARGAGSVADPFVICTATQFNQIGLRSADWNKNFIIKDNLDFNSLTYNRIGGASCGASQFTGVIDGDAHTITNLTYTSGATNYVGVFGCFNGTLKDLTFTNLSLTGQDYVGVISYAGVDDNLATVATVSEVKVNSGTISGRSYVGGIAGFGVNAAIEKSFTEVTLTSSGSSAGGIMGESTKLTKLDHNESKTTINTPVGNTNAFGGIVGKTTNSITQYNTVSATLNGRNKVGGIAGQVVDCLQFNNNNATVTIPAGAYDDRGGLVGNGTSCTFSNNQASADVAGRINVSAGFGTIENAKIIGVTTSGTITSTEDFLGGVVGYVGDNSVINKCHSSATVTNDYFAVGGIVGYLNTSTLSNCYFSGTVSSVEPNTAGALIGITEGSTISYSYSSGTTLNVARGFLGKAVAPASTYVNNYYNSATSALASAQLIASRIEAKTPAELQTLSTFTNWNFNLIWQLNVASFPNLLFNRSPGTFYVSPTGDDSNPGTEVLPWKTMTLAGSEAIAGDTIIFRGGVYSDRLVILNSGESSSKIIFKNYTGETPIISPSPLPVADEYGLVEAINVSNIEVNGLELTGVVLNSATKVPIGVHVSGRGENIDLKNLKIHGIENNNANGNAHGILVAGTEPIPLKNINIENNEIYDLNLGWSESLVLNGNVDTFLIKNNIVRDNNNIGIDIIGLEGTCSTCTQELDRARNGVVSFNTISNITSATNASYGGDLGAVGIYVDGGKDVVIENNSVTTSDFGIELASELQNQSFYVDNVIVRNNLIYNNKMAGLATGGYTATRKGCRNCTIVHNTFYKNNTASDSIGEFYIQHNALDTIVQNNIFYAGNEGIFINMEGAGNSGFDFNGNLYFTEVTPMKWRWNATNYASFATFKTGSSAEAQGLYGDPLFINAALVDFSLQNSSPAKDAGRALSSDVRGTQDFNGADRLKGPALDIGAFERQ